MEDKVVSQALSMLHNVDILLGEINELNKAYQARRTAATKLERREMPDTIPGLTDLLVCIEGSKNPIQKIIDARRNRVDDESNEEERDKRDMLAISSCNSSPIETQWEAVKRSRGLLALRRRFNIGNLPGATVDAVVENGIEWLKVWTISERRLVYQMAQEGWHPDDSEDEDSDLDDESAIDIVRTAAYLVKAARLNRCNNCTPRIHFFLPKINEGTIDAIDKVLSKVRHMGVSRKQEGDVEIIVDCANSSFAHQPVPPLTEALENLFMNTQVDRLTSTLNLELTLLISLVSDVTHAKVEIKPWYSEQSKSHIADEEHAPGKRLEALYVALRRRHLVCTEEVIQEFVNIVDDLGTPETRRRAELLLGRTLDGKPLDQHDLVSEFSQLSMHPTPDDMCLPVRVISKDEFDHENIEGLIAAGTLPQAAHNVWSKLDRKYNRACYLYGWAQKITTVSSNVLTIRQVDSTFDKYRTNATESGPDMFLTPLAISINTCRPCPTDKWLEIKDNKHKRKSAREKEAKEMKKAGIWGPSLGIRAK